ncbi:hypothetical protein D3C71_1238530 [compost metagenome]
MPDAADIAQQLRMIQEGMVAEVVRFDARLGQGVQRIVTGHRIDVVFQRGSVIFPPQPGLRGGDAGRLVRTVQATPVCGDHVAAFVFRDMRLVTRPALREHPACTAIGFGEPAVLFGTAEIDPAKDEAGCTFRMGLGVGECQRGAPGTAEHQPALDAEPGADDLHVGDQVLRRVVTQLTERRGAAAAALVDQDDAIT